ncbi:MAG: glycoside hydrolase family 25 protein [Bacteroides sp.]|nr:glycoside hydrolase family 25 protein [Bacteroides sp.]
MKLVGRILTIIAVVSVAGCFGFSAVSAMPEGEWTGAERLRNNRSYVVSGRAVLQTDMTVPAETVVTLRENAELIIPEGVSLTIDGGVNLRQKSALVSSGGIKVSESGTLSLYGSACAEESSSFIVSGLLDIRPEGSLELKTASVLDQGGVLTDAGSLMLTRSASLSSMGNIYIENDGELINGGNITVEEGIFDSSGSITVERKGNIFVFSEMNLREGSSVTEYGKIIQASAGNITDSALHTDLSVFSSDILKNEEEVILRGIDVSWVQGEIDWEAVSESGIDFAVIRAGRGDIDETGPKEDTHFRRNIEAANRYGIDVGVYFYSYAETVGEAEREAYFFLNLLDGYEITFPVVLDMEETGRRVDMTDVAEAFLEIISGGGYYPMLYSYQARLDNHFSRSLKENYAVWVAKLDDPEPDTDYDYYIWQYSHEGRVNGIEGNVDYNVAYRDFPDIFRDYGLNKLE